MVQITFSFLLAPFSLIRLVDYNKIAWFFFSCDVMKDVRIILFNQSCKKILVICLPRTRKTEREREKENAIMNDDDEDDEQKPLDCYYQVEMIHQKKNKK